MVVTRVDLIDSDANIIASTSDNSIGSVVDAEIGSDGDASIRRQGTATIIGDISTDLIAGLRNETYELQLWRGIQYSDGLTEMGSLGLFNVTEYDLDESGVSKRHRLSLSDRSYLVSLHKLSFDYSSLGDPVEACRAYLGAVYPAIKFKGLQSSPTPTIPTAVNFPAKGDPWQKTLDILKGVGCEAFFDPDGYCVIQEIPDYSQGDSVWSFIDDETSNFFDMQEVYSRATYNHVIVKSESGNNVTPITAEAMDLDPDSPTYIYGPYGDVPYYLDGVKVTTQEQANQVAASELARVSGSRDTVTISTVPNVFFEVDDVIYCYRSNSKIQGYYIIQKLSWPLVHDRPMYVTARRGRNV